jgi:hypothetical protein
MATDPQQGPGWWLASDGKWYPPESHPNFSAPLPPPPPRAPMPPSANPHYVRVADNVPEPMSLGARRGLSTRAWLTIAVCVLYVFSPVDLLPEALLGPFGLPDDLIVIVIGVKAALSSRRDQNSRRLE